MRYVMLFAALLPALCFVSSPGAADDDVLPLPRGDRTFGLMLTSARGEDYGDAIHLARSMGVQSTNISLNWDEVERAPRHYDATLPDQVNLFFPVAHLAVEFQVRPIDTNGYHLPPDLRGLKLDSPRVVSRFNRLLDFLARRMPDVDFTYVALGNEVDIGIDEFIKDQSVWRQYRRFFAATAAHARTLFAGVPIGAVMGLGGIEGPSAGQIRRVVELSDGLFVTFYPFGDRGMFLPPAAAGNAFDRVTDAYPGTPIYFTEVGYPSAVRIRGSEPRQAEFVRQVFSAWDRHAQQVPLVSFLWLTDLSTSEVRKLIEYYDYDHPRFIAYLATLGLRRFDGTPKKGLDMLRRQARARGW